MLSVHYLQVNSEQDGQRLDNFLLAVLKGAPRSLIYRLVRTGQVRINQGRVHAGTRVCTGDQIRIPPLRLANDKPAIAPLSANLRQLEAAVVYEDNKLLVLNKPAGLAVHGGSGMNYGVIEALRVLRNNSELELVHRLDRDTSGCLMIAKRRSALHWLHQIIKNNQLQKKYLALLVGKMPHATQIVDAPLRKNILQSGERIVRVDVSGKSARTTFIRLRSFTNATLVEAQPYNGRTHQIRVHAAHLGLPVAGDIKYGDNADNAAFKIMGLKRLFLHAASLSIPRLDRQTNLDVAAPLDPVLDKFLHKIQ
jgi:23S rRNA pseudouridine955/2504/2580 synthase